MQGLATACESSRRMKSGAEARAVDTLLPAAWTSSDPTRVGLWAQRMLVGPSWWNFHSYDLQVCGDGGFNGKPNISLPASLIVDSGPNVHTLVER